MYRNKAVVLADVKPLPKWRIVRRKRDSRHRWVLQRRFWFFWWTVDWHYDFQQCLDDYRKKTEKEKDPDTVVWDDVNEQLENP